MLNDKDDGNSSKFTVKDTDNGNGDLDYKIGLLTIDEIVYAGLKWQTNNTNGNYLLENAISTPTGWFTLSPSYIEKSGACVSHIWIVHEAGNITTHINNFVKDKYTYNIKFLAEENPSDEFYKYVRPSLSLKSTTTISSGDGTTSSPFVID